ncbi:MAG: hypothetical protein QOD06_523, partial [Candidatus Binatota bacterium]|nr:hypothetical protein [Candidatus Binatota bacterium]
WLREMLMSRIDPARGGTDVPYSFPSPFKEALCELVSNLLRPRTLL